jgi:ribosome-associated translation inhibitor RaiA
MQLVNEKTVDRRQEWVFRYRLAEVFAAAKERVEHHIARGEWWTKEGNKAEAQLRKRGFEYRERPTSYESEVQIVGDPELALRAAECRRKIAEHREQQMKYETWVRVLKRQTKRQAGGELELTINDIVFFGL